MKKQLFSPLDLDKETIAKLDESQLNQIVGGADYDDTDETNDCCPSGATCVFGTSCAPARP